MVHHERQIRVGRAGRRFQFQCGSVGDGLNPECFDDVAAAVEERNELVLDRVGKVEPAAVKVVLLAATDPLVPFCMTPIKSVPVAVNVFWPAATEPAVPVASSTLLKKPPLMRAMGVGPSSDRLRQAA